MTSPPARLDPNDHAWMRSRGVRAVMAALREAHPEGGRFVGGCVRNALLGAPVDDVDVATPLTPPDVIAALEGAGLKAVPTGVEHGTVTAVAHGLPVEVTTLRRDVATDGRRAVVAFSTDWAEDAQRRDFTMNALYADAEGAVFDPTGGLEDLAARRFVFIGDPHARIAEDYLRILRFFRFNAWYGRLPYDGEGLAACAQGREGLARLSVERVWKEARKLLSARDPRASVAAMALTGVLTSVLPTAGERTAFDGLVAIDREGIDPLARLSALLGPGVEIHQTQARAWKMANAEAQALMALAQARDDDPAAWRDANALGAALYAHGAAAVAGAAAIAVSEDRLSREEAVHIRARAAEWSPPRFPLSGADAKAAGLEPGPAMGEALKAVETWWASSGFPSDLEALRARLADEAQRLT